MKKPAVTREKAEKILTRLSDSQDHHLIVQTLVEIGKKAQPLEDEEKTECNLIPGCLSRTWLTAKCDKDCIFYAGDSDSVIMKGIIEVLASYYSGLCPLLITKTHDELTKNLDLSKILSTNRRSGTAHALNRIKELALEASKEIG